MEIFERITDIQYYINRIESQLLTVGFVPTMGALHYGHNSLIEASKRDNDITICSIFVNPIQFNNKNDFNKYPNKMTQDLEILRNLGCDVAFCPSKEEMYPRDENLDRYKIELGDMANIMEGEKRKGHFHGVTVVLGKLFDIVQPSKAYFGKKDYQQLAIVQEMVRQQDRPIEIIGCDTIREDDGLAMSSRNLRLSKTNREKATLLYQSLLKAKENVSTLAVQDIKKRIELDFSKADDSTIKLDYFEIVDGASLKPLNNWADSPNPIACIAAYVNDVRLIDNIQLIP